MSKQEIRQLQTRILDNIDDWDIYDKRHKALEEMFRTDGWKILIQEYTEDMKNVEQSILRDADSSDSPNNIWALRTKLQFFEILVNYEETENQTYQQAKEELKQENAVEDVKYPEGL